MIKVILFDVDGVIVHSERFTTYLERDYGIEIEKTLPFFKNEFKKCITGNADLKEILAPHLDDWGWDGTVDELLDYWFKVEHRIDEKFIEYVQELRNHGIKCYVATNQEAHRTQYIIKEMGFGESFDGVFSSSQLGYTKSSQDFFHKIAEQLGNVSESEMLLIDDTEENVTIAKKAGLHAVIFEDFEKLKSILEEEYLQATS